MSSFVAEVLASSGKLEKEDIGIKISKLSRRVDEVKGEVCDMINKKYEEFIPSLKNAEDLVSQVDGISMEIDLLKSQIENEVQRDLRVAVTEFSELKQQLEKSTLLLSVLRQLQEFDTALESNHRALLEKNYSKAATHLNKAQCSLQQLKSRKGFELKILQALSTELIIQKENLLYHLNEEWRKLAVWNLPPSPAPTKGEWTLKTELRLCNMTPKKKSDLEPLLVSILQAFAILGELNSKLKFFSQKLLKYILKPLIVDPFLDVEIELQTHDAILRFSAMKSKSNHTTPVEVYRKMVVVMGFLHQHLLNAPVGDSVDFNPKQDVILAEMLGAMIWKDLSESIIKNCLVNSIPANSSQLEQYEEVIKETERFEDKLRELQVLNSDSTDLLEYARNINTHFASKKCQDVIVTARILMTTEIHNTVKIPLDSKMPLPKLPAPARKAKVPKVTSPAAQDIVSLGNEKQLGYRSLCLPACRISESVQNLIELAYQTLSEATDATNECAVQLFYTVRNIFHLFYDVVPTYHKENLQKLPQLAAIHHNNCMYIAHQLITMGHQFRYSLPSPLCDGAATFVDLVPSFRRLGTECFLAQLRSQRDELLERLSNARNLSNLDDEDNYSAANKAVRQDISSEDADRLYSLCRTMLEEGPQIFQPLSDESKSKNKKYQEEVPVYVPKWLKFKELMIVLQASLQELVDRWTDGKGPLAAEFSPNEAKSLIRALFQNTERRAAALAKIK
uniref:Zw10 kinetochore protein n=1 Tax=Callorhinchus milii TaxID=7868 RepID=A0A4W3HH46_CALMI